MLVVLQSSSGIKWHTTSRIRNGRSKRNRPACRRAPSLKLWRKRPEAMAAGDRFCLTAP